MTDKIDYDEGSHQQFIQYLYSSEPRDRGMIQLESTYIEEGKNLGLHTFEQLLMIVDAHPRPHACAQLSERVSFKGTTGRQSDHGRTY